MKIINPKVNVVDFGPVMKIDEKNFVSPDEFVYGAANITYKDIGALNELIELKKSDKDISEKVKNMLIKVGGSGHASMATTPGFWAFVEGNSSKLIDSTFTTAKFGSSLMPSGRRVPITKEAIVIPRGIADKGKELTDLYIQQSENNIQAYFDLQERGVPKQEASKIVQYGHDGGGFMFMPLETLIHFSKLAERNPDLMPQEGHEIISQLEDFVKENGAGTIYQARKNAPRTGSPHPNIFHDRINEANDLSDPDPLITPKVVSVSDSIYSSRSDAIDNYIKKRNKIFSSNNSINKNWKELLGDLEEIINDFNDTIHVKTFSNIPWRVWGEVKRHRTLPQTAESIYRAVSDACFINEVNKNSINNESLYNSANLWGGTVSLPHSVKYNKDNLNLWINNFSKSLDVYEKLTKAGVKQSDAIAIIPRGIKLGVVKNFDLYNLTTGYMSLRLCGTAEPEMKKITELERKAMLESDEIGEDVKMLINPKCHYVGFCPEMKYQGESCKKVNQIIKGYNEEIHKELQQKRINYIENQINQQT